MLLLAKKCYRKDDMEKFKNVYNIIIDVWKVISSYKGKDVSQDNECKQILLELQTVCDKYRTKVGETEGKLTREICALLLEYLCGKEQHDKQAE